MIAGPYDAVKIWATERFQRVESHVRNYPIPGWGMHSERFLNFSVFPAMINNTSNDSTMQNPINKNRRKKKQSSSSSSSSSSSLGYTLDQNPNICFLRARADGSVWIEDCDESFNCDMESVVLQLLAKYHPTKSSNSSPDVHCTRKSIKGIKFQDILLCQEGGWPFEQK